MKLCCYEFLKKQYPLISKGQVGFSEVKRECPLCHEENYIVITFSPVPSKKENTYIPLRLD